MVACPRTADGFAASRRAVLRRRLVSLAALTGVAALGAGCDPCAGIPACHTDPRLSVSGQIVVYPNGQPAPGTRVSFVRTGGAELVTDSATVATDGEGRFHLAVDARGPGPVTGDVVVSPPGRAAYRVRGVTFRTSDVRGEGASLEPWVADPYVAFVGQLTDRRTGRRLGGAVVRFERRSGVRLAHDTVETGTNDAGQFRLDLDPLEFGDVRGDITVRHPGLLQPSKLRDVPIEVSYVFRPPELDRVWTIGASIFYTGELYFRGTGETVANATVTFTRTGGVGIDPASFTERTDAAGRFALAPLPVDTGTVIGDLIIQPPSPYPAATLHGVRLTTVDTTDAPLVRFGFGEQLFYVGELFDRGTRGPGAGLDVEFRRTAGISISPDVVVARTGADGRFPIAPHTLDTGTVVGDLTVRRGTRVVGSVPGVRLRTFGSDELRLAGIWSVGEGLFYVGELWDRSTHTRLTGIDVTFRRSGGIATLQDSVVSRTDAAGRFTMFLPTADTGEVVGDVVVRSPARYAETVSGIRLHTFGTDELRLGRVVNVGPSLAYVSEVHRADTDAPVVGATVEFRRTGGIAATPDVFSGQTTALGRFAVTAVPDTDGVLVGTVTVHLAAPWRDTTIVFPNVTYPTFRSDSIPLRHIFTVPPPP